MRRALGLQDGSPPTPQQAQPTVSHNGFPRPPRHFVRDGEVPVTVIHRDESSGTNQLEVARQTIRSLTAAKEATERSLVEAQATIQQLRTQLAHEQLARDEVAQRAEGQKQAHEQAIEGLKAELAAERAARQQAERQLANALQGRRERATDRHGHMIQTALLPRRRGRPRKHPIPAETTPPPFDPADETVVALAAMARNPASSEMITDQDAAEQPIQPLRHGRPSKVSEPEDDFVEWWKPGWKKKYR